MTTYITDANGTRWALVPVKMTDKMNEAVFAEDWRGQRWRAAISTAPPFPTEQLEEPVARALHKHCEEDTPSWDDAMTHEFERVWYRESARFIIAAVFKDGE